MKEIYRLKFVFDLILPGIFTYNVLYLHLVDKIVDLSHGLLRHICISFSTRAYVMDIKGQRTGGRRQTRSRMNDQVLLSTAHFFL